MSFDVSAAHAAVNEALDAQYQNVLDRALGSRASSSMLAQQYAEHLYNGGDPREHPSVPLGSHLVNQEVGMNIVYFAWNEARGSTNPVSPVRSVAAWQVAEHLHEHVGEPVLLAVLTEVYRVEQEHRGRKLISHKGTPDEIANAVVQAQTDALIARKTKVGGKVAYILREAKEGEERATSSGYTGFSHEDPSVKAAA